MTNLSSDSDEIDVSRGPTPVSSKKRSALSLNSLCLSDVSVEIRTRLPPEDDSKEYLNDECYHIVKEMLCGEWTTRNDLKLINEHYFGELRKNSSERCHVVDDFVTMLQNVASSSDEWTMELESSVGNWKDASVAVGNVILCVVHNAIPRFRALVAQMPIFVAALHQLTTMNSPLSEGIRTLDDGGLFFVDILWMLVRLAYKTVVWQNIFARLVESFLNQQHIALGQCRLALEKISTFNKESEKTREGVLNYVKLVDLERILHASQQLVQLNRKFVREGYAHVSTAQGTVRSMLVLFGDSLLIASASVDVKSSSRSVEFFVEDHIPLREIMYEEGDSFSRGEAPASISIHHCGKTFVLGFVDARIKEIWMQAVDAAVRNAKETPAKALPPIGAPCGRSVSFSPQQMNGNTPRNGAAHTLKRGVQRKSPFLSCWNQQQTIDASALQKEVCAQVSGYIARHRFAVDEWQFFWAVICAHNIVLYTSHGDMKPVAFIPLIGCTVGIPSLDETFAEGVEKSNFTFKVENKSQSFVFCVENRFDLARWINEIYENSLNNNALDPLTMLAITR